MHPDRVDGSSVANGKLEVDRGSGDDDVGYLGIPANPSAITECVRLRCMDEEPIAIETLRLSLARHPWLNDVDWDTSVHQALEDHGTSPARADVFVDVVEPDSEQRRLLQLVEGQSLLRVTSRTSDSEGVPVSLDEIAYHPAGRARCHHTRRVVG